jgi:hypothetical protein
MTGSGIPVHQQHHLPPPSLDGSAAFSAPATTGMMQYPGQPYAVRLAVGKLATELTSR